MFPLGEEFLIDRRLLGRWLRAAREESFLTLRDVEFASGLGSSHVSKIERGCVALSVDTFARMCFVLGLPPGLPLEYCSFVGVTIYKVVFFNDAAVKERASRSGSMDSLIRKKISDFLAGIALTVSYLIKSSNPCVLVENIKFPLAIQLDKFRSFAKALTPEVDPESRRAILASISVGGFSYLKELGLVDDDMIESYLASVDNQSPTAYLPWIPVPKPPFFKGMFRQKNPLKRDIEIRISNHTPLDPQKKARLERKLCVDILNELPTMPGVSSENGYWKALVQLVLTLTSKPGAKAQLARDLKTSRQAVNKWFSGKGAPSAELTLQLLAWAAKSTQKRNAPGNAANTSKGKSAKRKASHENNRSKDLPET